jgi:hypothetical protein
MAVCGLVGDFSPVQSFRQLGETTYYATIRKGKSATATGRTMEVFQVAPCIRYGVRDGCRRSHTANRYSSRLYRLAWPGSFATWKGLFRSPSISQRPPATKVQRIRVHVDRQRMQVIQNCWGRRKRHTQLCESIGSFSLVCVICDPRVTGVVRLKTWSGVGGGGGRGRGGAPREGEEKKN